MPSFVLHIFQSFEKDEKCEFKTTEAAKAGLLQTPVNALFCPSHLPEF
jgi:hypothetical protein